MSLEGKKILYAEDNPDDHFLMKEALRAAGLPDLVIPVEDGAEAVEYLKDGGRRPAPALALLDIKMPRMTGLETLAWIRATDPWRRLPVVIFSASMHPGDVASAYELGANTFLLKPSSAEDLTQLVSALCAYWLRFAELPPIRA